MFKNHACCAFRYSCPDARHDKFSSCVLLTFQSCCSKTLSEKLFKYMAASEALALLIASLKGVKS